MSKTYLTAPEEEWLFRKGDYQYTMKKKLIEALSYKGMLLPEDATWKQIAKAVRYYYENRLYLADNYEQLPLDATTIHDYIVRVVKSSKVKYPFKIEEYSDIPYFLDIDHHKFDRLIIVIITDFWFSQLTDEEREEYKDEKWNFNDINLINLGLTINENNVSQYIPLTFLKVIKYNGFMKLKNFNYWDKINEYIIKYLQSDHATLTNRNNTWAEIDTMDLFDKKLNKRTFLNQDISAASWTLDEINNSSGLLGAFPLRPNPGMSSYAKRIFNNQDRLVIEDNLNKGEIRRIDIEWKDIHPAINTFDSSYLDNLFKDIDEPVILRLYVDKTKPKGTPIDLSDPSLASLPEWLIMRKLDGTENQYPWFFCTGVLNGSGSLRYAKACWNYNHVYDYNNHYVVNRYNMNRVFTTLLYGESRTDLGAITNIDGIKRRFFTKGNTSSQELGNIYDNEFGVGFSPNLSSAKIYTAWCWMIYRLKAWMNTNWRKIFAFEVGFGHDNSMINGAGGWPIPDIYGSRHGVQNPPWGMSAWIVTHSWTDYIAPLIDRQSGGTGFLKIHLILPTTLNPRYIVLKDMYTGSPSIITNGGAAYDVNGTSRIHYNSGDPWEGNWALKNISVPIKFEQNHGYERTVVHPLGYWATIDNWGDYEKCMNRFKGIDTNNWPTNYDSVHGGTQYYYPFGVAFPFVGSGDSIIYRLGYIIENQAYSALSENLWARGGYWTASRRLYGPWCLNYIIANSSFLSMESQMSGNNLTGHGERQLDIGISNYPLAFQRPVGLSIDRGNNGLHNITSNMRQNKMPVTYYTGNLKTHDTNKYLGLGRYMGYNIKVLSCKQMIFNDYDISIGNDEDRWRRILKIEYTNDGVAPFHGINYQFAVYKIDAYGKLLRSSPLSKFPIRYNNTHVDTTYNYYFEIDYDRNVSLEQEYLQGIRYVLVVEPIYSSTGGNITYTSDKWRMDFGVNNNVGNKGLLLN